MDSYRFRYVSLARTQAGSGHVGIAFERLEGTQFVALISVEDAQRLVDDLPWQILISVAKPQGRSN